MSARQADESTARGGAIVRIGFPFWLRPFLFRDVIGITIGRRVFVAAGLPDATRERVIRHETAHVEQVRRLGLIRFLWRYLREYVANRRRGMESSEAYARISFEVEARRAEDV